MTEFKWYEGPVIHKLYLNAILGVYNRRIITYKIGRNRLVFNSFITAAEIKADARPPFHSDRGFQYTSKLFRAKPEKAGMTQSMSRVGRCIDNGPIKDFWCIPKGEQSYEKIHK